MLIDTHAHLNFDAFKDDADQVIGRSLEGGTQMINVGSQYETSQKAVELAEKYQGEVYAAIGLHPIHASEKNFDYEKYKNLACGKNLNFDYGKYKNLACGKNLDSRPRARIKKLAKSEKVVAIGEIGLDYFHKPFDKNIQRTGLCTQLDLAKELNLPAIIHCRSAHEDLVEILNTKYKILNTCGVIHCFTGSWEEAQKYLEMGFYLGFNGIIFKLNLDEIIKKTPLDRILLETDCPYLTPLPAVALAKAGPLRNEPLYVKYIAQRIAEIKGETFKKIAEVTTKNAKELFKLP